MTEPKKRGRPRKVAIKPELPLSLSYTADDGADLLLRAYDPVIPEGAEGAWVRPKYIAGIPQTAIPEHLRGLTRSTREGLVLIMSHVRPSVNAEKSDDDLIRLEALLRRLEVTNITRDKVFHGRRTTVNFTIRDHPLKYSRPNVMPVYVHLDSVEVEV